MKVAPTSNLRFSRLFIITLLVAALAPSFLSNDAAAQEIYYRLQLKHNGKYLDANHCSDRVALHPGSDYDSGACQLWRLVPAGGGWSRLQLKHNRKYLDAVRCSDTVALHPGSDYDGGACQLWRLVPAGGGWSRLVLKHNGKYLDAVHCSDRVALHPGSDYDGGACQLWRLVRETAASAPAPQPRVGATVRREDERCYQYAKRAVEQYQMSTRRPACRVRPDGRWQPNYENHYQWCLTTGNAALSAEQDARDNHLSRCGAQSRID